MEEDILEEFTALLKEKPNPELLNAKLLASRLFAGCQLVDPSLTHSFYVMSARKKKLTKLITRRN